MKTVREEARDVPVAYECDVCVVGGSCTGVFAAVRAARLGARVALIENNGFFGGVATAGLVSIWHQFHVVEGTRQIISGLTEEIIKRLDRRNAVLRPAHPTIHRAYILNTEELKIELDELVSEAGVRPFLHARFVESVMKDGRLAAVIIEDKTGRRAIPARYFIDASGDGDLAARMGLQCSVRGDLQPPTTVAILENYSEILRENKPFDLMAEVYNPKHGNALKSGFLWGSEIGGRPGAYMVAGTRAGGADCSDADQLTAAEIECRRQVRAICDILRNNVKGGGNIVLSNMSAYIGIRETRHVECLYNLTAGDLLEGVAFEDAIACGTYGCDIHHSDRPGITMRYLDGTQKHIEPGRPPEVTRWRDAALGVTPFYQIPYRSIVPVDSRNVLVAGRLIGCDRGAYGAVRVMVNCNQTGEAAGVAAALCLKNGCDVAALDTALLRGTMREGGSIIV